MSNNTKTDSAAVNLYETSNGQTLTFDVIDGTGHAEALKITSGARDITVYAARIIGGTEDCVDVNNHCRNIRVIAAWWEPRGEYLATIKGESDGITLEGRVANHAKKVEVDCGNWSDQGNGPTRNVTAMLEMGDGSAFKYRLLNYAGEFHGTNPKKCTLRLPPIVTKLWLMAMTVLKKLRIA